METADTTSFAKQIRTPSRFKSTRGSKVFNTIIQMEAEHLRENLQTPQQQETLQAIA